MNPEYQAMWEHYRDLLPQEVSRQYQLVVWRFLIWLADRQLNEKMVLKYLDHLREKRYADGSVKWIFTVLQRFAKVNKLGWEFRRDEIPQVRESEVQNYALPTEDVKMMVDVCLGRQAPMVKMKPQPYHTAFLCLATVWWMRAFEMRVMTSEDLDLGNRMLYINTAKHGRQRYHRVPDFVAPYLEAWNFDQHFTQNAMARVFLDLRRMIGFNVYGIGWHSIRRAAVKEADRIGMSTAQKNVYGRWTVGSNQQAVRYSMAKTITRSGSVASVGFEDEETDQMVYTKHTFVDFWR